MSGTLSIPAALAQLRGCLSEGGAVIPGSHFRKALADEGRTIPDAWHVLRSGRIYDPPERDIKTGEWKYKVEGFEPGGKWLVIVFCFKASDEAFLITVYSAEARRKQ